MTLSLRRQIMNLQDSNLRPAALTAALIALVGALWH